MKRPLLAGVSVLALVVASPSVVAARSLGSSYVAGNAAAAAAATAQVSAQQAAQALSRMNAAMRALQAQQTAARAAAAGLNNVPNGLAPGGLQVAPGAAAGPTDYGAGLWQGASLPTQAVSATGRTLVEIRQKEPKAILNWSSFNVGRDTDLYFNQTVGGENAGQWIALNRVNDPSLAPSRILGTIRAEGQVYIINKNGILFGGGSQVNVNTLVASSLTLSNAQFKAGIDAQLFIYNDPNGNLSIAAPQFGDHASQAPDYFRDINDPLQVPAYVPDRIPGSVTVATGAAIDVASGGKALLFAPAVQNHGRISAPDGQVVLAAGEQVWIANGSTNDSISPMPYVRGINVLASAPLSYAFPYDAYAVTSGRLSKSVSSVILPQMAARAATAAVADSGSPGRMLTGYQTLNDGVISTDRGNITMVGRSVTQNGLLVATTALNNREGSIRLLAWDEGMMAYSGLVPPQLFAWSTGTVTLGPGSVTTVLPDPTDTGKIETSTLSARYTAGQVTIRGKLIDVEGTASLFVPSGIVNLVASASPSATDLPTSTEPSVRDGSRIYIAQDAFVSVGGVNDVVLPMENNVVAAELRINELRDSILYRDSWLRSETIYVDRRKSGTFVDGPMAGVQWGGVAGAWTGTPLADVSSWLSNGTTTLAELSTVGGTLTLKSSGSIITRSGSLLDVSGGSVRYADGWVKTTKLLGADGRIYDIANATPDRAYVGIYTGNFVVDHPRWRITETFASPFNRAGAHYEPGYTEGRAAGTLRMYAAEGLVLEGAYAGGVVTGERQLAGTSKAATAGTFTVGGGSDDYRAWLFGNLVVASNPVLLPDGFTANSTLDAFWYGGSSASDPVAHQKKTSYLDSDTLTNSGFGRLDFYISKSFTLGSGETLELAPKTSLSVSGNATSATPVGDVRIGGTIRIAGGSVALAGANSIALGAGSLIDVSGEWVNDFASGPASWLPAIDGGTIKLSSTLSGTGAATLDVSGGGWLTGTAVKPKLKTGSAGAITVASETAAIFTRLDLRAYAAGSGGTLTINTSAPNVQVGGSASGATGTLYIPGTLFTDRGFRSLSVVGSVTATNIVVPNGAVVKQTPVNVDLSGLDLLGVATGTKISQLGPVATLPDLDRIALAPAGLSLSGLSVTIGAGAVVQTDIKGNILLGASTGDMTVNGTLIAPAGSIALSANTGKVRLTTSAQLLARGAALSRIDALGVLTGSALDGGSIAISGGTTLTLQSGSLLDVSGASAETDVRSAGSGLGSHARWVRQQLASNGGTIALSDSGNGTSTIDAKLLARAGGIGAAGGSLSITETSPVNPSATSPLLMSLPTTLYYRNPATGAVKGISTTSTTFDFDIFDEYAGAVTITSSVRGTLSSLRSQLPYGILIVDGDAADAGTLTAPVKVWDYTSAIPRAWVELINKYYYANSALTTKVTIPDMTATTAVGVTRIAAGAISDGGFSNVTLETRNNVSLGNKATVNVPGTLTLNLTGALTSRLTGSAAGTRAALIAQRIVLNSAANAAATASTNPTGELTLSAELIELLGTPTIRGFGKVTLEADEIRVGSPSIPGTTNKTTGGLDVDSQLTLDAGEVYPVSMIAATIKSAGKLTVLQKGAASLPYSVAGSLTLIAPDIEQDGTLRAPFGTITLSAANSLTLGSGSVTSVSGEGLILPYGSLSNGEYWTIPGATTSSTPTILSALPEKKVALSGKDVNIKAGAVVDISGGGDLYASEFVTGPGGSHDVLAMAGVYAIIPSYTSVIAPRDASSGLAVGDRIWLAGGGGLAAGWYTLLPGQYALLPGAYAVQMVAGSQGSTVTGAVSLTDGATMMAGYRANTLTGGAQQIASSWRVMPGSVIRSYSEYNEAFANTYFASDAFKLSQYRLTGVNVVTPRLPMDGGSLALLGSQTLLLNGILKSQAAAGGIGGNLDISGGKIAIVGTGQNVGDLSGYLLLDAASLTRFGAASLLIGGARTVDAAGTRVTVGASNIVVRNDEDSALTGPEVIFAATGAITLDPGSVVAVEGDIASRAGDLIMTPVSATADYGALIRVSNGAAVNVSRQNVITTSGGLVTIGAGVRLSGGKSLLIDATANTVLASSAKISGDALTASSGRIGIGGGSSGLVLSAQNLAKFADARLLTLRSYSTIDLYGSVDFGGAGVDNVVLDAGGLVGYGTSSVTISGDRLTLRNSGSSFAEPVGTGSGTLDLSARELVLGAGAKAVRGFDTLTMTAGERILGEGNGTLVARGAVMTLTAPVITGRAGASQSLTTTGALVINGGSGAVTGAEQSLGTRLAFVGRSIAFSGHALALGGAVELTATGGDVELKDGALIDVGGLSKTFFDVAKSADAGRVALTAVNGNVKVGAAASINLSGASDGGGAGALTLTATGGGTVTLDGAIAARAIDGERAGSFSLDIDALPNFAALSQRLNDAGFLAARQFRIHSGDVTIDGTNTVGDFDLVADRGAVTITGRIDSMTAYGGHIAISAGNGITMNAGASLIARATSDVGGGRVLLDAAGGRLNLAGGVIDVSGGEGGKVRLRALQTDTLGNLGGHADAAVDALNAQVLGARSAVLEAVSVYNGASVDAIMPGAAADATAFMSSVPGSLAGRGFAVMAGIEVRSSGDLTLASDLDLNALFGASLRQGGLTLRAAGNLVLNGNLSDGFSSPLSSGTLQSTRSWDLRLVGGADLNSAGMLATVPIAGLPAGSGSVVIGSASAGKLVRTGTGDIAIRAGRDIQFANYQSAVYSAGRKDTAVIANFTAPAAAVYGVDGGNLSIVAAGSITAPTEAATSTNGQTAADWVKDQGAVGTGNLFTAGNQTSWWVDYRTFANGMAALGGGNVSVTAGGDLANLQVALATNGRVAGGIASAPQKTLVMRNGGSLDVNVGGAVRGGEIYVARGQGIVIAGEFALGRSLTVTNTLLASNSRTYTLAPVLALGDAALSVTVAGDLRVQTVLDVLMAGHGNLGLPSSASQNLSKVSFTGYTDRTTLDLTSVGGDVILVNQGKYLARALSVTAEETSSSSVADNNYQFLTLTGANLYPARTTIAALNGNVRLAAAQSAYVANTLTTMPAAQPELQIIAEGSILSSGSIVMARANRDSVPSPMLPTTLSTNDRAVNLTSDGATTGINDDEPSRFYARSGSIQIGSFTASEPVWIRAGRDIGSLVYSLRNLKSTDVSLIEADNDINLSNGTVTIQGPGSLLMSAGRDIYAAGGGVTVVASGNQTYGGQFAGTFVAGLPAEAADISILAGLQGRQPAYGAFTKTYLDPQYIAAMPSYLKINPSTVALPDPTALKPGITTMVSQVASAAVPLYFTTEYKLISGGYTEASLIAFVASQTGQTLPIERALQTFRQMPAATRQDYLLSIGNWKATRYGLDSFVADVTGRRPSPGTAWTEFSNLPELTRQRFLRDIYVLELRNAGDDQETLVDGKVLNGGYNRGYAAIATLFPGSDWRGEIKFRSSLLRTYYGGNIELLAPGGGVEIAAANASIPSGLGLVALGDGRIDLVARDSVTVNQSRILTFGGGDIVIWSTLGDIDAGRGAKTARSPSRPTVATDVNANTTITEQPDISGSGIGTVIGFGSVPPSDVALITPEGTVNAGDAGIRVSGNLLLSARLVLNVDNIKVGGEVKGMPKQEMAAVTPTIETKDKSAETAAKEASQPGGASERPSIIMVEFLGFGGGDSTPDAPRLDDRRRPPHDRRSYDTRSPFQIIGAGTLNELGQRDLTDEEKRALQR
ncbi:filamentous haemagglutinin family protein [Bradyrhizobium cenepequi]